MFRKFVDRREELKCLEEEYHSEGFKFVIVYGRRRVGKTALIRKFLEDKHGIFFLCSRRGIERDLERFAEVICKSLGVKGVYFRSFIDAFNFLRDFERLVIVFDEFPYLIECDRNVVSDFQIIVDEILSDSNHMLILCGSSVGMVEREILSYKSPLYGRATKVMKVRPFKIDGLVEWFGLDLGKVVKIYGVTNGIPKYMEFFKGENVEEEIVENFFNINSFLYNEAYMLLSEELRAPSTYSLILEAISSGHTRVSEISNYTGIEAKDLPFYLSILSNLGIVKREIPVTETSKSKRGIYLIDDEYFRFWFRFVSPHREAIEIGEPLEAIEDFRANFDHYLGFTFEKIVKQILYKLNSMGRLPFRFERIGKWWRRGEEIDLIALNRKLGKALFIEVKWKTLTSRDAERILKSLERRSKLVNLPDYERHYMIVARKILDKPSQPNMVDLETIREMLYGNMSFKG